VDNDRVTAMTTFRSYRGYDVAPGERTIARGALIASNFAVERVTESLVRCEGCGREFSAFDLPHYSLALESTRLFNQNRARAARHADRCKGMNR
jgi:hypothetical protein